MKYIIEMYALYTYKEHESVTIQNKNILNTMVACTVLTTMDDH